MEQNNFEKRNLILAIVVSAAILFAADAIFPRKSVPVATPRKAVVTAPQPAAQNSPVSLNAESVIAAKAVSEAYAPQKILTREEAVDKFVKRILTCRRYLKLNINRFHLIPFF